MKPNLTILRGLILVISIVTLLVAPTLAQKTRSDRSWEIGLNGGVSTFLTSFNPASGAVYKKFNYWNSDIKPAISLSVIKHLSPALSVEFEWLNTHLSGKWNLNNGYPIPTASLSNGQYYPDPFKTSINEFNLDLVANINHIIAPRSTNEKWYAFIKGGGGAAILNAEKSLYPYAKTSDHIEYTIQLGGGLAFKINHNFNFKIGTNWYRVETDRLDGIHTLNVMPPFEPYYHVKECYLYSYAGISYRFGKYSKPVSAPLPVAIPKSTTESKPKTPPQEKPVNNEQHISTTKIESTPILKRKNSYEIIDYKPYTLQLGAYRTKSSAFKELSKLKEIAKMSVIILYEDGFHKVRLVGYTSKDDAHKAATVFAKIGFPESYFPEERNSVSVQFGAFDNEEDALKLMQQLSVNTAKKVVILFENGLYKVQIRGFLNREEAQEFSKNS